MKQEITWQPGEWERFDALRAHAAAHHMMLLAGLHRGFPGRPHYLLVTRDSEWIDFDLGVMKAHIDYQIKQEAQA
jgi:hypothetical protein